MTIWLSDSFDGTGDLSGQSPTTTFAGQTWSTFFGGEAGTITKSGGAVLANQPTHPADEFGEAYIGDSTATTYALGDLFSIDFTVLTKAGLNVASGPFVAGILVYYGAESDNVSAWVSSFAGEWTVFLNSSEYTTVAGGSGAVVSSTQYPGTFSYDGVNVTLVMFGQTFTLAHTLAGAASTHGVSQVKVLIGDQQQILSVQAQSIAAAATATLNLSCPPPSLSATGFWTPILATLAATSPSPTLRSAGHDAYGDQAAFLTAPSPTLTAYCGGHSALTAPSPVLTVTATVVSLATAALTAPSPTVTATGVVTQTAAASLSAPIGTLIGYSGAVCSITVGCGTITASGTTGSVGRAALTCPLFELVASATAQNYGSALLTAPSGRLVTGAQAYLVAPTATLTAIGTATVTATYEAYALNLNHSSDTNDEVTHYTNFPFTHVVRYKNSYYGANSTGLYLLDGTTDDSVPIAWSMKTAFTDFDTDYLKNISMAYFGGRLGPNATIGVVEGESGEFTYSYSTPRGSTAQNYRQPFGKGLRARYYAIFAGGSDVATIDSITFNIAKSARKV